MNTSRLFDSSLKKLRPFFIPFLRIFIRYSPYKWIKKAVWIGIIEPFFEFTKYSFFARTVFGVTIAGNTEDQIQRYIYYFGIWEPNLTEFIESRLKEGDFFIDVGANIGYFSLLASKLVGESGKVIAIEASPKIHTMLYNNIRRNGFKNIETLNIAISDKEETLKLFTSPDSNIGQTSVLPRSEFKYECDILAKPLSEAISLDDFSKVRLIKIDVEGAEWFVLSGLIPVLRYTRDDIEIVVELSPDKLNETGKNVEDIITQFHEHGFYPYNIKNDYSTHSYLEWTKLSPAKRISSTITTQTDVIFSRTDASFI